MKHFGLLLVAILIASYSYSIIPDRKSIISPELFAVELVNVSEIVF